MSPLQYPTITPEQKIHRKESQLLLRFSFDDKLNCSYKIYKILCLTKNIPNPPQVGLDIYQTLTKTTNSNKSNKNYNFYIEEILKLQIRGEIDKYKGLSKTKFN